MEKPKRPLTRSAAKKIIPAYETSPCHEVEEILEFQPPPGKKVMFSAEVLDKEKLSRHVTRSTTRRQVHDEDIRTEMHVQCVAEEVVEAQYPS
jgi:hypothetical protein